MHRIRKTAWSLAAVLLAAVPVSAETFYRRDGVVFEGTLRKVVPQAAVCKVLEQNHTSDEYDRLKPDQGQPRTRSRDTDARWFFGWQDGSDLRRAGQAPDVASR